MCVDRMFNDDGRIEISCLMCGKRVFINQELNIFGRWLGRLEKELVNSYAL
jgi:hypothetical protein